MAEYSSFEKNEDVKKANRTGLFPALLKHWRGQRGLSQLDLAIASGVSGRHVSFLETGRSVPSADMVLRLGASLDVPLRHINAMLEAAGHEHAYPEGDAASLPEEIRDALRLMKAHHDPFPLIVMDSAYNAIDLNAGGHALFSAIMPDLAASLASGLNLALLTFDPAGAQPALANFDEVGRTLLWRIQREALAEPDNGPLQEVLSRILEMPTLADDWRNADLSVPASAVVGVHLKYGEHMLRFVTTVTSFQAPQTVLLDELRIEHWFPANESTAAMCQGLGQAASSATIRK